MTETMIAQQTRIAAARLFAWAKRRALEPSTWIGLGMAATSLGYSTLGKHLTAASDFLPMILGVGGAGLAAATTSARPAVPQQQPDSAPTSA